MYCLLIMENCICTNFSVVSIFRKEKPNNYESNREKSSYQSSYGLDETIDLSTKWRAPPASERKSASSIGSTFAQPASASNTSDAGYSDRTSELKRSKSMSHHARMLPRKRLHTGDPQPNSTSSCSSPDVIVLSDEEKPRLNGHINGYESDSRNSDIENMEMPPLPQEKVWDPEELKAQKRKLRELQDELRSEEMKLVLLKKLHQSQMVKDTILNQAAAAVASKMVPTASRGASSAAPPPLVRSGQISQTQITQNKMLSQQLSHQSPLISSPLVSFFCTFIFI